MWHMPVMFMLVVEANHIATPKFRGQKSTNNRGQKSTNNRRRKAGNIWWTTKLCRIQAWNCQAYGEKHWQQWRRWSPDNIIWASGVPEAGLLWAISLCETINSLFFLIQLHFLSYLTTERILSPVLLNKQQTQTVFLGFEGDRWQKYVNISLRHQQFFKQPQGL